MVSSALLPNEVVLAITPGGRPDARMVASAVKAGAWGVLDLGAVTVVARRALRQAAQWVESDFGVRIAGPGGVQRVDLPVKATSVVLDVAAAHRVAEFAGLRVLVEVTSVGQALAAADAGAAGVIARGRESGGQVGVLSAFVLLQQLVAHEEFTLPVWVAGGVGPHTAPAAIVGGAHGVVLDVQLALLEESRLPAETKALLESMDGAESVVEEGVRIVRRRVPGRADLVAPIGQDGFLAKAFHTRWRNVGAAVRGVRQVIAEAVAMVGEAASGLEAGSVFANELGTALPLAQGPMTRVSDQALFARAVADGGGLPFIALAVNTAEQSRVLLESTQAALGRRPWGVGVLGFADPDLRAAQLDVVLKIRPTHAIIAGGRPAQAQQLEAAGISTFLHVPSPGLLRQFLDAGARKFVFEGAECGGHVGPRHSFPLWEAQLAEIEHFLHAHPGSAHEVQVFFAGGIHDARSAAMVAAMASAVSQRGVRVGLLMGTAYLFTEEAVAAGAIGELFQQQVVAAAEMALLETAPGHATRCVASPFTEEFGRLKRELHAQGVPEREVWERLEQLNIGRLRIASKGVDRVGGQIVAVNAARQVADGMFMAGDVAVLRSSVSTISELHDSVSSGAAAFALGRRSELAARFGLVELEETAAVTPVDVAIVGMSAIFPQAPDLSQFWANILAGVDAVTEVPPERWDAELYYRPDGQGQFTPSKWGGFLPQIPFDPLRFGIPPASLGSIEPVQLLALEAADRALADAGYRTRPFDRARTAVIFGAEAGSDMSNANVLRNVLPAYLGSLPPELDQQLPKLTEDFFPGVLANVISGRIANRLDLGGANYTVDAACASSLAALDAACKELVAGAADMVLCGGADLHNGINDYLLFASVHALSAKGRSATFDSSADGIALGEGVGCVVLKRLEDAQRDGDRVYAVVKGVGSASDGRSLGLTAPRPEGQRNALERAYRNADVSPADVGLIEAHGTGTVVGDRTELATLTRMFVESGAEPGTVAVGSIKSQIGHTKCAAGLAGLIKAALAIYTGVKPPTLHVRNPNPAWDAESSPFVFNDHALPWAQEIGDRVAGVSAFGFGGTNFHAVLAGCAGTLPPTQGQDLWPAELFTFRGADLAGAVAQAKRLLAVVQEHGDAWALRDYALSAARVSDVAAARGDAVRIAIVAESVEELFAQLAEAVEGQPQPKAGVWLADDVVERGKVAFLFPGQGSQRPRMGAELMVAFPELQQYLQLGAQWADTMYPPTAFTKEDKERQRAAITDTRVAQPALGVVELAYHELLTNAGITPDMVAGHSYGELAAFAAAGAIDPATLLELSAARAEAIVVAADALTDRGAMAAVSAHEEAVRSALVAAGLADDVVVANNNSHHQNVISGPTLAVEAAVAALREGGLSAKRINVSCAFHSPVVAAASELFGEVLALAQIRPAQVPVFSNQTARAYAGDPGSIRAGLAAQISAPVRFVEQVEQMYAQGARVFVEVGPGSVLTRLTADILADRPHTAVAMEGRHVLGTKGLLNALAQLAVAGVDLRTEWLFSGRNAVTPAPAQKAKKPGWTVDGHLIRKADGSIHPGALQPATRVMEIVMPQPAPAPGQPQGGAEALIAEFLRTSREMVAAQRDVLMSYLGVAGAPQAYPAQVAPVWAPQPEQAPQSYPATLAAQPLSVATAAPDPVTPSPAVMTAQSVLAEVFEVIGNRTGYPVEMIEPDLDLEADLSIDSIKRAEIAGELAVRLGLGTADDTELEEVSKARTASAIAGLLLEKLTGDPGPTEPAPAAAGAHSADNGAGTTASSATLAAHVGAAVNGAAVNGAAVIAPQRLILRPVVLPPASVELDLRDKQVLVVGAGPLADTLAMELKAVGAQARSAAADIDEVRSALRGTTDVVYYLASQHRDGAPELPEMFPVLQVILAAAPPTLIAAGPGEGLRGLFRTIDREYPGLRATVLEPDGEDLAVFARALVAESAVDHPEPVVLLRGGARHSLVMTRESLGTLATAGAGPAGDGRAEAAALGLDADSVVLLVGGGRGITARFAATLASAARCRVEIVGRTAVPAGDEPGHIAAASTPAELRAALIATGMRAPAEIEAEISRIEANREVRDTIARLGVLASSVNYRSVDFRDAAAVRALVQEIHSEHGRLDGVVYAAGVIEDKLIAEKTPESFRRVFDTKVGGARALLDAVEQLPESPRFAVFFGSIAAALGNRGQSDYAAANDELERIARAWTVPGTRRGLAVHWGPWAPTGTNNGMVTPELMRSYGKRGISLIDPEEGTSSLLRELAWGSDADNAVVYTASGW